MNLKGVLAGVGILAGLGGVIIISTRSVDISVDAVAPEMRFARVVGECPKGSQVIQTEKDYTICLVEKESEAIGEVKDIDPAKAQRLVVCKLSESKKVTRWESQKELVGKDCIVAAQNTLTPNLSTTAIETDIEKQLRESCKPCGDAIVESISAGHWGLCPECLIK